MSPDMYGLTFHVNTPLQDQLGTITPSSVERPPDRPTGQSEAVECLRARHLVHKVHVDVQQVRFTGCAAHHVAVPQFLGQGLPHRSAALLNLASRILRR